MGNHGLTQKMWSSYRTASSLLKKCCWERKIDFALPVPHETILIFIHWLANERKVKAGTINLYLAGIRQLHVAKGFPEHKIRSDLVNLIVRGKQHMDAREKGLAKQENPPVTIARMKNLKKCLKNSNLEVEQQLLVWSVCTLACWGALRMGEILSSNESFFDPAYSLLARDIRVGSLVTADGPTGTLHLLLKSPKESKLGASVVVDIYETGDALCPLRAFNKWRKKTTSWQEDCPAFRQKDGTPLTTRKLNKILASLAGLEGRIKCHDFRRAAASMLASLGFSDDDIKALGRWSSRAFEEYIRLPRTKRAAMAKEVARRNR